MQFKTLSVLDKIQAPMNYLYELIEEIEQYPDKSLFYQNPLIFQGWVSLIREIEEMEPFSVHENKQTTETYVL